MQWPDPGALFAPIDLSRRELVLAAVSGGGDSLALILLLHEYLRSLSRAPALLAVTIDHGLRSESAKEAHIVGKMMAAWEIPHRILTWTDPKPVSGISEAARNARINLLAQLAREVKTDMVLTGHTADDQAETVAMRLSRGTGRGVAGIAPATLFENEIWFVRPLLSIRRNALRDFLRKREIGWIDDPSNWDQRFERSRVRQELQEEQVGSLLLKARAAAAERERADRKAAKLISGAVKRVAPGLLCLPLAALKQDFDIGVYALRILLAVAGSAAHLPDEHRTATLLHHCKEGSRTTLARAVIACRKGNLYLYREYRNLPRMRLRGVIEWDGRYRIHKKGASDGHTVAALGRSHAKEMDVSSYAAPPGLVRAAFAAEPAVWKGKDCLGIVESWPQTTVEPLIGRWARLIPSFDVHSAEAVAQKLGARSLPPLPWRSHKEGAK